MRRNPNPSCMKTRLIILATILGGMVLYAGLPNYPCGFGSISHQAYVDVVRYSTLPGMPPEQVAYLQAYVKPMHCPMCHGTGRTSRFRVAMEVTSYWIRRARE